jgi:DNA invertase Pin-like site-specific DNA recombinase
MATKKLSKWMTHLLSVYHEMKRKDSKVRLKDAMKQAKKTYKG